MKRQTKRRFEAQIRDPHRRCTIIRALLPLFYLRPRTYIHRADRNEETRVFIPV